MVTAANIQNFTPRSSTCFSFSRSHRPARAYSRCNRRHGNQITRVLECPLERSDKVVRAFDLEPFAAVALGVFDEIRVSKRQAEIGE